MCSKMYNIKGKLHWRLSLNWLFMEKNYDKNIISRR